MRPSVIRNLSVFWLALLLLGLAAPLLARDVGKTPTERLLAVDTPLAQFSALAPTAFAAGEYWSGPQSDGSVALQIRDAQSGRIFLAVLPQRDAQDRAKAVGVTLEQLEVSADGNSGVWAMWSGGIGTGTLVGFLINNNGIYEISYVPR